MVFFQQGNATQLTDVSNITPRSREHFSILEVRVMMSLKGHRLKSLTEILSRSIIALSLTDSVAAGYLGGTTVLARCDTHAVMTGHRSSSKSVSKKGTISAATRKCTLWRCKSTPTPKAKLLWMTSHYGPTVVRSFTEIPFHVFI